MPILVQNESFTGLVCSEGTVFPIPLALFATWQQELAKGLGEVVSKEGRAIGEKLMRSPVADVARDACWGRVGETFGEDPMLVAHFSSEEVKRIQGEDYRNHCGP